MTQRTQTAMHALADLGQAVWLDYLRRGMLRSGELQGLIDDGLRGMTSNPTIFEHAIGQLATWRRAGLELSVSVNVSARQFESGDLVETVNRSKGMFPLNAWITQSRYGHRSRQSGFIRSTSSRSGTSARSFADLPANSAAVPASYGSPR